jgi:hypothetical protein
MNKECAVMRDLIHHAESISPSKELKTKTFGLPPGDGDRRNSQL